MAPLLQHDLVLDMLQHSVPIQLELLCEFARHVLEQLRISRRVSKFWETMLRGHRSDGRGTGPVVGHNVP